MKLKNAVVGEKVSIKRDIWHTVSDLVSRNVYRGEVLKIDQVDARSPELRLVDEAGTYVCWLSVEDVRRVK